jgi:hypothetical protein
MVGGNSVKDTSRTALAYVSVTALHSKRQEGYLGQRVPNLISLCYVTSIEGCVVIFLYNVEDGYSVAASEQLLDDVSPNKPAASKYHVDLALTCRHIGREGEEGAGRDDEGKVSRGVVASGRTNFRSQTTFNTNCGSASNSIRTLMYAPSITNNIFIRTWISGHPQTWSCAWIPSYSQTMIHPDSQQFSKLKASNDLVYSG